MAYCVKAIVAYDNFMYSKRFLLEVRLSHHAKLRMVERDISEAIIIDLIETGAT